MKRKVVSQGPSSMMVSLPIKWVKEFGIAKGDEVDISQQGQDLLVSSESKKVGGKIVIELESDNGLYVYRHIQAAYVNGYDEIEFKYSSPKIANTVQESLTKFVVGFELIAQSKEGCIIKSISTGKDEEFDILFKRVFQGILQMDELFYDFLKKGEGIELILNLEKINNRQVLHLQRILHRGKVGGHFLYAMLVLLEKLANEYKFIIHNEAYKGKIGPNVLKYYTRLHKQIENVYDVFVNYDSKKVSKIVLEDIRTEEFKVLFKENAYLTYSFMKITDLLRSLLFQVVNLEFVGK
ncbi:MAG: AbrB/MazE/SpoVT family DNA-binding domain-containing protein [Nanoarchaeota archaeon]|jgi:phosphate uptake regulator|nr:AbrB/MazE/SpoVT family DNA-binding domain-containing protein [Nanoarchaeota archaeon]